MYRALIIYIVAKFAFFFLFRGMLKLAIKNHEKNNPNTIKIPFN